MHILPVLLAAGALSAGNAEFDRLAVSNAAEISVARIKDDLGRNGPGRGVLKSAMLADPSRFVSRQTAVPACRDIYLQAAEREFRRRIESVRSRLSLGASFAPGFSRADREKALSTFEAAYKAERSEACSEQAERLVSDIRPPMKEVDVDDENLVRKAIARRIVERQRISVFEENLGYISEKMARPMAEAAKRERRRQADYIRRVRSDAGAPSSLAADLKWKLSENIRDRRGKSGVEAWWDVFPSVTNEVMAKVVDGRITRAFAGQIEESARTPSEDEIIRAIQADREAHRTEKSSLSSFKTALCARYVSVAKDARVADVPEKEKAELAAFLDGKLSDRAVVRAVESAFDERAVPVVKKARKNVAGQDFEKLWPTLVSGTWHPDPVTADEMCAHGDLRNRLKDWRRHSLTGLSSERAVLEETDRAVGDAVLEAFVLARTAISSQIRLVDAAHPEVLSEVRSRKESLWSRTPDLEAVIGLLTKAVETRWKAVRQATLWPSGNLPPNAAEQHVELFPSVKKRIELVAREILDEIAEKEPSEDPSDSEEEVLAEYTIVVSRQGEKVNVRLEHGGRKVVDLNPRAKVDSFREAMISVAEKLGVQILRLPK